MNALKISWADDDVTQTVDPLGRSGAGPIAQLEGTTTITLERGSLEAGHTEKLDCWPIEVVDEAWDASEDAIPLLFRIDGDSSVVARLPSGDSLVTSAEGVVKRIEESRLWLGTPGVSSGEISLSFALPGWLDMRHLVGRRVRLTLVHENAPGGGEGQTLTISTRDGRVWLVARYGGMQDVAHTIAGTEVRAALSQRPSGPLVVGTPELQLMVTLDARASMNVGKAKVVVDFISRDEAGCAAYVIADEALSA